MFVRYQRNGIGKRLTGNRVFDPPEDNPVQKFSRSVVPNGKARVKDQTFSFDRIFDQNTSQGEVYESTTRSLLDNVLEGYNATVFAYGATGCGKTHTITGTAQQPGIIYLTMQELFERLEERSSEKSSEISLSYLEIYNESIRDLLAPDKNGLILREDSNKTVSVAGLSSHHPQTVQEVMDMIMKGNECRTMSPTEANATSSRSHAVLQINVAQKDRNADINEPHTMSTLSVIDLAGSERASATKNKGERLFEGANINKSLLALGSCINALCDSRRRNHVPYRNSKLTRLLKFSLGGNCKTVMIVCVSPSSQHFDETQNTLRYANRAKNIQTKVTRNVFNVNRHVKDFLVKIDEQMNLINELKAQQKESESIAFAKFKKQTERKSSVIRESISRVRSAYEHSMPERKERIAEMLKLRQITHRISMLSCWIAAFDTACEKYAEDDQPLQNLQTLRKTAQGMLLELENSKSHYHRRLAKNNWDRGLNSAVDHAADQLREFEISDNSDYANVTREAELLKSNAEREALSCVAEQEKSGDAMTIQTLLQAQFEALAGIEDLLQMDGEDTIEEGKKMLADLVNSGSGVASAIVKPDGSSLQQAFSPGKGSTPRFRNRPSLFGVPASNDWAAPVKMAANMPVVSPVKGLPRRRKVNSAKKSVSFSPKRVQAKSSKRSVRWMDNEQPGILTESPKAKPETIPEVSGKEETFLEDRVQEEAKAEMLDSKKAGSTDAGDEQQSTLAKSFKRSPTSRSIPVPTRMSSPATGSSPIPIPPEPSLGIQKNSDRFKTGFLSKNSSSSPLGPAPSVRVSLSNTENSPLRSIENSSFLNSTTCNDRPSKTATRTPSESFVSRPPADSNVKHSSDWKANKEDAIRISSAIRSISGGSQQGGSTNQGNPIRVQRRRSPASSGSMRSSSQENYTMFTSSHTRRIGRKEHEPRHSVLGARSVPVMKNLSQRRVTLGGDFRPRDKSLTSRDAIRLSLKAAPKVNRASVNAAL